MVSASRLPQWKGFNLVSKFSVGRAEPFPEWDFEVMHRWGFDFARLPMDYRCWVEEGRPDRFREDVLREIDEAVELGRRYGIHVCINFHRAPGWTVARPPEERSVWTDAGVLDLCALHWRTFARRYRGIPSEQLSFNLFNEPARIGDAGFTPERYRQVVLRLTDAIWSEDPDRLVICDGYEWGRKVVDELRDLGVAQSTRAYEPHWLSHYKVWDKEAPPPTWPGVNPRDPEDRWDRERLRRYWQPWKELKDSGVGVHCGEGGGFKTIPHGVFLAWLDDALSVLDQFGIGWAIWNLRGSFGVLDSGREDVEYEQFEGHLLDRAMLDVLLKHL